MKLRTLDEVDLKGKTILYRAPYDIAVKEVNGELELVDDMRISATIPTLQYLLNENCKIVILTYVGRPDGVVVENLRTTPHARCLEVLLNHPVVKVNDCIGEVVEQKIAQMNQGSVLMLENVRFYKEENIDDDNFAKELCKGKDIIVFDGFPQAHRIHASTTGILRHLPAVSGMYLEQEVNTLSVLLENPVHPFTVIIGGAKISDKVDAILNLMSFADTFLVGGAVANVFLKAEGKEMGASFIEDVFVDKVKRAKKDWVEDAKGILKKAKSLGKDIVIPEDVVVSDGNTSKVIDILVDDVPVGYSALDIGKRTEENFARIISESKTIFINGPMGKFEDETFSHGSEIVFNAMKNAKKNFGIETIVAGGDTIEGARKYGSLKDYSHISLAGGASLEFLAGKELPALKFLIKDA